MRAVVYFSTSKQQNSKRIAMEYEGDHFRIDHVGKHPQSLFGQLFYFGSLMVKHKELQYTVDAIDLDKYDEFVFVSPVWGGRVNPFMAKFLQEHPLHGKTVTAIGASNGTNPNYVSSYAGLFDPSNRVDILMRLPKA